MLNKCNAKGGQIVSILCIKKYLYETIDGKRKRVSPFVMDGDTIVEIKERAIVGYQKLKS